MACLKDLENKYENCTKCQELVESRTNVVFGVGNPDTCKVVIIGEAPGKQEDLQKTPFVGRSGKLLDGLLEEIGLQRPADVYITNTVLCRPPDNRNPTSEELKNCKARLDEHISILSPKVVVTLGNFATKYMLETKKGITSLRGKIFEKDFFGKRIKVLPMFHPAVLLYNGNSPKKRAEFQKDFIVLKELVKGPEEKSFEGVELQSSLDSFSR
jgi:DNA polymerase